MADNAFDYAAKNNLIRTNEIHQEQEAKLVLEEGFSHDTVEGETSESRTTMVTEEFWLHVLCQKSMVSTSTNQVSNNHFEPEDPDGEFLESDLPSSSRLDLLRHTADEDSQPEDGAVLNSGSFKLLAINTFFCKPHGLNINFLEVDALH